MRRSMEALGPSWNVQRQRWLALFCLVLPVGLIQAAGEVTDIETRDTAASPSRYTVDDTAVQWGQGSNQLLDAFIVENRRHTAVRSADRVEIRRVDRSDIATGEPCSIFAVSSDGSQVKVNPDFPRLADSNGNCDTAAILAGNHINRGALNLFSNRPPSAKNIERVDFLFETAANAPFDVVSTALAGHLIGDKNGNNPVQIAAILELDENALPAAYGPLVRINTAGCTDPTLCFGVTSIMQRYAFMHSQSIAPQQAPVPFTSLIERAAFAYVSADALGLSPGQRYHGVSLFPDDVDVEVHSLTAPAEFPNNTEDSNRNPGDSIDVFGGSAGLYLADTASIVNGRIACRASNTGNTTFISGASIRLHVDVNDDGVLDDSERAFVGEAINSFPDGHFQLTGVVNGSYLLTVESPGPEQSPDDLLTSMNPMPIPFVISESGETSLEVAFNCNEAAFTPTANDDSFTLFQQNPNVAIGSTVIDVLANDLDPLGQGLQIVEVQGSDRGSLAIIEDGQALGYTPTPGRGGQDTFSYTLGDGAGQRDVARVIVSVNLLPNDPGDESDCTPGGPIDNCMIDTEVDGHGFGRVGGLSLLVLLLWTGGRCQRQRSPRVRA